MKHYYWSDVVNEMFASEDECRMAEEEAAAERVRKQRLADERDARQKEVDEAYAQADKLAKDFVKDYGVYSFRDLFRYL